MRRVYLDHSATTPIHPEVAAAVNHYMLAEYGNSSSIHSFGEAARKALESSRDQVAELINASDSNEIVFTSGGTESDNLAIKGAALANAEKGKHIITSEIEHHAVLHTCEALQQDGFRITIVGVDEKGMVDPEEVENVIEDDTVLITMMMGNNEVGTIQPIKEIAGIAEKNDIIMHTDAVQCIPQVPVDVQDLGVDLLSISAHKMYGPKGVGALYIRKGTKIAPQEHGGHHENRKRAGTENIPGIVGLAEAARITADELTTRRQHLTRLRDKLIEGLLETEGVYLNGHPEKRLPNNVSVSVDSIEGESMLLGLNAKGIAASSGSACTSESLDPSHVLLAMGMSHELAHGSLRMTLGRDNSEEDIEYVIAEFPDIVDRLRNMSPLNNQ